MPVIIVEKLALKELVDDSTLENIDNIKIPFYSLGNNNGLLSGFKPDYIKVYTENDCLKKEVIIGIYNESFSSNYNAIIGL